ncbi:UNVERIFIED_CONTAM: hypothetical protein FKN15_024340 [Acipenser sinensis]
MRSRSKLCGTLQPGDCISEKPDTTVQGCCCVERVWGCPISRSGVFLKGLSVSGCRGSGSEDIYSKQACLFQNPPPSRPPGCYKDICTRLDTGQVHNRCSVWQRQRLLSSTALPPEEVSVVYQNGLPVISVSLPSRRERCQFTLKPISDSVGVFLQQLQAEDRGIDRVAIYSADGTRVASSTGIDILLLDDFKLVINDTTHDVRPPKRDLLAHEDAETLSDVKMLVQQLYTTLRIEEHQLHKERQLIGRLENLNSQILPFEKLKEELSRKAEKRATWVMWGGMAYMATQFGILARLTWWEYSWDIMEPVTYFITYGSSMAMYAYFVLTRQEYIYPDARDRQYLLFFHKGAKKNRFDIEKYNQLKDAIAELKEELSRKAEKRATWVMWGGMAYMATQFGILARLTWWEYSWDIMEPVTYFITYGSSMAMYAYFVLTRQVRDCSRFHTEKGLSSRLKTS